MSLAENTAAIPLRKTSERTSARNTSLVEASEHNDGHHANAMATSVPKTIEAHSVDLEHRMHQCFPRLSKEQMALIKPYGTVEKVKKGTILFQTGERDNNMHVIIKGSVSCYDHTLDGDKESHTLGPNEFTGELSLLNDRGVISCAKMAEDGEAIVLRHSDVRRLLVGEPELAELLITAFILRRTWLVLGCHSAVVVLDRKVPRGSNYLDMERFCVNNGYPFNAIDYMEEPKRYDELMARYNLTQDDLPVLITADGKTLLRQPSNYEIAKELGLLNPSLYEKMDCSVPGECEANDDDVADVVILGGGPAGLSATVYGGSEGLNTYMLETVSPGGQAATSSKIENYMGFPTGISGAGLAGRAWIQCMKFGSKICVPVRATGLDTSSWPYTIQYKYCHKNHRGEKDFKDVGGAIKTKSVIMAMGARYRTLPLPNGREFDNAGVYYAATNLECRLCMGSEVVVVGGGNSAGQATKYLSQHVEHVHLLVRRDNLEETMSNYLIVRIEKDPRVTVHYCTEIVEMKGEEGTLKSIVWKNKKTGKTEAKNINHVFLMIGATPNTAWVPPAIKKDEKGFLLTGHEAKEAAGKEWDRKRNPYEFETSVPGVFAVGDVVSGSVKRVASGVGIGAVSVSYVFKFLEDQDKLHFESQDEGHVMGDK